MRYLALLCLFLGLTAPAFAQDGPHRKLESDSDIEAWRAVGRLNMGDGYCTAAMIAPRLVLTAAHCLYSRKGALRRPEDMTFHAAYRNGRSLASRRGRRMAVHRDYVYNNGRNSLRRIASDIALVELETPIDDPTIVPFKPYYRPQPGDEVIVVSYGRGRDNVPSLEKGCQMTKVELNVLFYTCDIDFGSSGSPIFAITDAGPKITSVISSGGELYGREVALGASLGAGLESLLQELAVTNPESRRLSVGEKGLGKQLGRSSTSRLPQITR